MSFPVYSPADLLRLKSGQRIEGEIVREDDRHVIIVSGNLRATYFRNDIKEIEKTSQPSSENIPLGPDMIEITLNPMQEFDYQTKSYILARRNELISKYPELAPAAYHPYHGVFGGIENDKPWWSTVYGPGRRSIEGHTEESRFYT